MSPELIDAALFMGALYLVVASGVFAWRSTGKHAQERSHRPSTTARRGCLALFALP